MQRTKAGLLLALTGMATVAGGLDSAVGQDKSGTGVSGGTTYTFGVNSTLRYNDNLNLDPISPGRSIIFDTRLSFGLTSETPSTRFSLALDGVLRAADLPTGSDTRFDDPGLVLGYVHESANSRITADAAISLVNLDFLDPFEVSDDVTGTDLIVDTGQRLTRTARVSFETGLNAPFGVIFDLGHEDVRYRDTTDPSLYDNRTNDYGITARLRLSPVADGRVVLKQEDFSGDDAAQTRRRIQEFSFGVAYAVSPVTMLDLSLGVADVRETVGVVPVTTSNRGLIGTFGLTRDLPNGTAGVLLDQEFGINGGRTTLSFSRALEMPSARLSGSLGVSRGDAGDTVIVGAVDFTQVLPNGQISLKIDRGVATDTDGNDILGTRAGLEYTLPISPVSAATFGVDYIAVANAGAGTAEEVSRTGLRASYSHSLTRDWNLTGGFEHLVRDSDVDGTGRSNSVFLRLERDFVFRR